MVPGVTQILGFDVEVGDTIRQACLEPRRDTSRVTEHRAEHWRQLVGQLVATRERPAGEQRAGVERLVVVARLEMQRPAIGRGNDKQETVLIGGK